MKYFFDTEFIEGEQTDYTMRRDLILLGIISLALSVFFLLNNDIQGYLGLYFVCLILTYRFIAGALKRKTKPTVDLISIGIVDENGREYYAVSKDFNLKEAWNRKEEGEYWIRENALKPIFKDMLKLSPELLNKFHKFPTASAIRDNYIAGSISETTFTYHNFKWLLKHYGKSNKVIAEEIKSFIQENPHDFIEKTTFARDMILHNVFPNPQPVKFYAFIGAHDWAALMWLFGSLINRPNRFPISYIDLKTMFELKKKSYKKGLLKDHPEYPKNKNKHNALSDAKWNHELYNFLMSL